MTDLPKNVLTESDITLLENAGVAITNALALKEQPTKLRLALVDIQAQRWEIGRRHAIYKGHHRDMAGVKFRTLKSNMSQNAASKEVEFDDEVIKLKNTRDLFETAYEVMEAFVNTNQTSLRLATEEAKNTL